MDGLHQRAVGQARRVKVAREFGQEQAAEAGEPEPLLAAHKREEDDLQALPLVDVSIPSGTPYRLRPQGGERIALRVELTRGRRRAGCMEQFAVLGDGEEDQAIDE